MTVQIDINDLTYTEKQISLKLGQLKIEDQQLIWSNQQKQIILPYENLTSSGLSSDKIILFTNGCEEEQNFDGDKLILDGNYQIFIISDNIKQIYEQINIVSRKYYLQNDILINNDSIENNYAQDNSEFDDVEWTHGKKFEELIKNQDLIFYDDQEYENQ